MQIRYLKLYFGAFSLYFGQGRQEKVGEGEERNVTQEIVQGRIESRPLH